MLLNSDSRVSLLLASSTDREEIYQIRHTIYALELQQHHPEFAQKLTDELDLSNQYIVAKCHDKVIGFISITTPSSHRYSVDKYFLRSAVPYAFDEYLYEIRLLTVVESNRYTFLALALMYAAYRWVESHGGRNIVAICRTDLIGMYIKAGLQPLDVYAVSGKVTYQLSVATIAELQSLAQRKAQLFAFLKAKINWQLPYLFTASLPCYHGGSFFEAIGENLQTLHRAKDVINADVLDAWFPPAPKVLSVLTANLPWLLQTSPPTYSAGLIEIIAEVRGLRKENILPGAGSSNLIFLAFQSLLNRNSHVLIIDPCYGEYFHVLEKVVQCRVQRFKLSRKDAFVVDVDALALEVRKGYDMVVLVNPNSPTGLHIQKSEIEQLLLQIPCSTLLWIDETYIEFVGSAQSTENMAINKENVIVCKSMSKVYSLSGLRAAYLCCSPHLIESLKFLTPPWALSLPAQAAAIAALTSPEYYLAKYLKTHVLRNQLKNELGRIGFTEVIDGVANFLLFFLPKEVSVLQFINDCKRKNLFIRDVANMGSSLGPGAVRIAVKDEGTNVRMISILEEVLLGRTLQNLTATPGSVAVT